MKLLEKIKDDYAKERDCDDWIDLLMELPITKDKLNVYDEVAKRYAKAVLERAADNALLCVDDMNLKDGLRFKKSFEHDRFYITVDKQSILNTDLE